MRVWLAQVSLLRDTLRGRVGAEDLPGLAAEHGFSGVEWLDRLLPSFGSGKLARLGQACRAAGLGPGGLSLSLQPAAPPGRLAVQTRRCLGLLESCSEMGVEYVRVALGGGGFCLNGLLEGLSALRSTEAQLESPLGGLGRAAYRILAEMGLARDRGHDQQPPPASQATHDQARRALEPLAQRAAALGLRLGVENHWGLSGRPDDLKRLVCNLTSDNVGICLDLDNFYKDQNALAGVAVMASKANHVHYKVRSGDPVQEALNLNYKERLNLLRKAGYQAAFSVEYEGPEPALVGAVRAAGVLYALWEGRA